MNCKPIHECTPEEVLEINTCNGEIQIGNVINACILQEAIVRGFPLKRFMADPLRKNACGVPLSRAEKYIYRKYKTLRHWKFIPIPIAKQALRICKQLTQVKNEL